jgi:hypothetical protein
MPQPAVKDIPKDEVGETVQGFIDDGVTKLRVERQQGKKKRYTVTPE